MGTFCGKTTVKFRDKKLVESFSAGKNNSQPTKIYTRVGQILKLQSTHKRIQ